MTRAVAYVDDANYEVFIAEDMKASTRTWLWKNFQWLIIIAVVAVTGFICYNKRDVKPGVVLAFIWFMYTQVIEGFLAQI